MEIEDISFVIRRRREELGLTQRELADQSGVHLRSINQIESAKANPTVGVLNRLAVTLKLELILRVKI